MQTQRIKKGPYMKKRPFANHIESAARSATALHAEETLGLEKAYDLEPSLLIDKPAE